MENNVQNNTTVNEEMEHALAEAFAHEILETQEVKNFVSISDLMSTIQRNFFNGLDESIGEMHRGKYLAKIKNILGNEEIDPETFYQVWQAMNPQKISQRAIHIFGTTVEKTNHTVVVGRSLFLLSDKETKKPTFDIDHRNLWTPFSGKNNEGNTAFILVKAVIDSDGNVISGEYHPISVTEGNVTDFKGNVVEGEALKEVHQFVLAFKEYSAAINYIDNIYPEGNVFPAAVNMNMLYRSLPYTVDDKCILELNVGNDLFGYLIDYCLALDAIRISFTADVLNNKVSLSVKEMNLEHGVPEEVNQHDFRHYKESIICVSSKDAENNQRDINVVIDEIVQILSKDESYNDFVSAIHPFEHDMETGDLYFTILSTKKLAYQHYPEIKTVFAMGCSSTLVPNDFVHFNNLFELAKSDAYLQAIKNKAIKIIKSPTFNFINRDELLSKWLQVCSEDMLLYIKDRFYRNADIRSVYCSQNTDNNEQSIDLKTSSFFDLIQDHDAIDKVKTSSTSVFDIGTTRIRDISNDKDILSELNTHTVLAIIPPVCRDKFPNNWRSHGVFLNFIPAMDLSQDRNIHFVTTGHYQTEFNIVFKGKMNKDEVLEILNEMAMRGLIKDILQKELASGNFLLAHVTVGAGGRLSHHPKWQLTDFPEVFIR